MEAATTTRAGVSSFSKSLFLGEIHEDVVFPYPKPDPDDQRRTRELVESVRELAASGAIDPWAMRRSAGSPTS